MESTDCSFAVALKGHMLPEKPNAIYSGTKIEASCFVVTSLELETDSHKDPVAQKMRQGRPKTD